jgi:IclR family KDG regulon transcriptional repressor
MTGREACPTKDYAVPAVMRAFDILELLAAGGKASITEISRGLSLPKSSVFGLLRTLELRGYVRKNPDDRYSLTLKLLGLGGELAGSSDLRQHVAPLLRELAARTRITAHLAVLDANEAVYIDKAEAPGSIRLTTYVGHRVPLHSTSLGKALLAWLPEDEVNRIVRGLSMGPRTPHTITSPAALRAELAATRQAGYAVVNEENESGVRGVAAPVFDHTGRVAAAVNLGGTVMQIRMKDVPALGNSVASIAAEMSRRLGFSGRRG